MSRKRSKMSKKTSMRIHAQKRAIQRYGIFLNSKELKEIVSLIQDNCGSFLEKISNRVTNWKVKYKDRDYIVGYDKLRKSIITFLPQEAKRIFAESQANVEKERQLAEAQKIRVIKEAEAQNESAILAAEAQKKKKILDAEGERDANLAQASGILAIGKAQAEANTLLRDASYAGESGAWKAKVEIATQQATKFATIANKISVIPEKAWISLSGDAVNPKPTIQAESSN